MNPLGLEVAGLDPSLTSFGWASQHGVGHVETSPRERGELVLLERRMAHLRTEVLRNLAGCHLAVIEGLAFGGHNSGVLDGLHWVIRVALFGNRIAAAVVQPTTLKKFATGDGGATKDEMIDAARAELLYFGDCDDEADALWLRQMGLAAYGCANTITVTLEREQALGTVDWPVGLVDTVLTPS